MNPLERHRHEARYTALGRFFSDSELMTALDWDAAAVTSLGDVTESEALQVMLMLELCDEFQAYLQDEVEVARWIITPSPHFPESPAARLRLEGQAALDEITHGLPDWMPKLPEEDLAPIDSLNVKRPRLDERAGPH